MSDTEKYNFVYAMYDGLAWKQKVRKMSDAQIYAIWKRETEKQAAEAQAKKEQQNKSDDVPF